MNKSQKLVIDIEGIINIVPFSSLDPKLIPLVKKLEVEGDIFGPVNSVITMKSGLSLFVSISYANGRKGPVKPTILGYDQDEFLAKQYK
jgi:hypothetical protein